MKIYGRVFRCYNLTTLAGLLLCGYQPIKVVENEKHPGKLVWVFEMSYDLRNDLETILNSTIDWIV